MILQRSSPPWLETSAEVFDKGVFTPNDQHYVSWHWVDFPSDIDVDADVMGDFSAFEWPSDLTGGQH
jgi:hypothetical protein